MMRTRATGLVPVVALACVLLGPGVALGGEADDVAAAHGAVDGFADVAAAEAAGYGLPPEGPLHECITSMDDTGAMGLHHINGTLVGEADLDPAMPEALVYEPGPDGGLTLVAAEYVVFAEAWDEANDEPPMLFGQMFMLVDEPNRYELPSFYALHAWLWKDNPNGTYAAFNPDVSCSAAVPDTALAWPASSEPIEWIGLGLVALALLGAGAVAHRRTR